MLELIGKTAFVTGGASGIGLALGRAFAQAGMKVMLADVEATALQAAVKSLQEFATDVHGTLVTSPIPPASTMPPKCHSKPSATCMWFATTPAAASTTSRSTTGAG